MDIKGECVYIFVIACGTAFAEVTLTPELQTPNNSIKNQMENVS